MYSSMYVVVCRIRNTIVYSTTLHVQRITTFNGNIISNLKYCREQDCSEALYWIYSTNIASTNNKVPGNCYEYYNVYYILSWGQSGSKIIYLNGVACMGVGGLLLLDVCTLHQSYIYRARGIQLL